MPEAKAAYSAPTARVPRTISEHMHTDQGIAFPPVTGSGQVCETFLLTPDNFNGLDALILWVLGGWTGALTLDITIDIGSCDELYNVHTQTVNAIAVNTVINEWECVDLTATFATVLANLVSTDKIRIKVLSNDEQVVYIVELELQES